MLIKLCVQVMEICISLDTDDMEVHECGEANDTVTSVSNEKLEI